MAYRFFPLRFGSARDSDVEILHQALNAARGTAYNTEPGTAVWVENLAIARALSDLYAHNRRHANQAIPNKMSTALTRWERILGLPRTSDTDALRRARIAAKLRLFHNPPINSTLTNFLTEMLGAFFVEIVHTSPSEASSNDGSDGYGLWYSSVYSLAIRVYQPAGYSDQVFYDRVNSIRNFLDDYLPAHVTAHLFRFCWQPSGVISVSANNPVVTGTGTQFSTGVNPLSNGRQLEVVDDEGILQTLTVDFVHPGILHPSDTVLTAVQSPPNSITLQPYRVKGFFLDNTNLDNACFA
jgi:uncharacterized protein YmfQ (DUF2313 family)